MYIYFTENSIFNYKGQMFGIIMGERNLSEKFYGDIQS